MNQKKIMNNKMKRDCCLLKLISIVQGFPNLLFPNEKTKIYVNQICGLFIDQLIQIECNLFKIISIDQSCFIIEIENIGINKVHLIPQLFIYLVGPTGCLGPQGQTGSIQGNPIDFFSSKLSNQDYILYPSDGNQTKKNIVFSTEGFGSFWRDDISQTNKGNTRGTGSNDLSISRNQCTQVASSSYSLIGGGEYNTVNNQRSVVFGGNSNLCGNVNSGIIGGSSNTITLNLSSTGSSFIGGGERNLLNGIENTIFGGNNHSIPSFFSTVSNNTIGGGSSNYINSIGCTILGGNSNYIQNNLQSKRNFIGGGFKNNINFGSSPLISLTDNFIGGGNTNIFTTNNFSYSNGFIGGGQSNVMAPNTNNAAIVGGLSNRLNYIFSDGNQGLTNFFIGGGENNTTNSGIGSNSFLGGGKNNTYGLSVANSPHPTEAVLGGGENNSLFQVNKFGVIGGGKNNKITSNNLNTILGGSNNLNDASNPTVAQVRSGCFIGGGSSNSFNLFTLGTNAQIGSNNTIMGGELNQFTKGSDNRIGPIFGFIGGGIANTIHTHPTVNFSSSHNCILGGSNNTSYTQYQSILGGVNHLILSDTSSGNFNSMSIWGGLGLTLSNQSFSSTCGKFNTFGFYPSGANGPGFSNNINFRTSIIIPNNTQRYFSVGNGTTGTSRQNAFSVTPSGIATASTGFSAGSADFAEWFDADENINPFQPVYFENEKVHLVKNLSDVSKTIGVSSLNPLLVGNAPSPYYYDVFGRQVNLDEEEYFSSTELNFTGSLSLFEIQTKDQTYYTDNYTNTGDEITFDNYFTKQRQIVSQIINISTTENKMIPIYQKIKLDGSSTLSDVPFQPINKNHSSIRVLVGLKGQLLIHQDYRNLIPERWIRIEMNHTKIIISDGLILQELKLSTTGEIIQNILGKTSKPNQIEYYDLFLIR
jgi:hypothetical protein